MTNMKGYRRDGSDGEEEAPTHTPTPTPTATLLNLTRKKNHGHEAIVQTDKQTFIEHILLAVVDMAPLKMPLKEAAIELAKLGISPWLKAHGKLVRPEVTRKQTLELRECFELIDADGLGVISTHDVPLAFTVLGMDLRRTEIEDAIHKTNANHCTMEFPQFVQLILSRVDKLPLDEYSPSDSGKSPSTEYRLPFGLLAQAYRRKKLIEAVMGGDKQLQDRMKFRSHRSLIERKALRDFTSGKSKEPKEDSSMTLEPTEREKRRAKAAALRKPSRQQQSSELVALPFYLIANVDPDVRELLLGQTRNDVIKAFLDEVVKFIPPTNKSVETDRPLSGLGGDLKLSPAYLQEKLATFRTELQHKPTLKRQVIRVQALNTLRDFYKKGSMQVKGSPFLYPASRRPTLAP